MGHELRSRPHVSAARAVRVAIVGAGPHGLTIAAHLLRADPHLVDEIAVIDPSGRWMSAWRQSFAALEIEHLRSPAVHHPDPDPYALLRYAEDHGRRAEFFGRYQSPGSGLFDAFCDDLIQRLDLNQLLIRAAVHCLESDGALQLRSIDGEISQLRAQHLVLAHGPRRRIWPDWTPAWASPPGRCQPVHSAQVDLNEVRAGQHVVVIGGGLTAGHLVCGATRRGAKVDLLSRRELVEREFDTDPGWLGPKEMDQYLSTQCLHTRARMASDARGGGSIPAWMLHRLRALEDAGSLTMTHGAAALPTSLRDTSGLLKRLGTADHLWCATGWSVDTRDPLLAQLQSGHDQSIQGALPLSASLELCGGDHPAKVHVVGRSATLQLGPTAGNLAGARAAAQILVAEICGPHAAMRLVEAHGGIAGQ
jgi:hypothetical protein